MKILGYLKFIFAFIIVSLILTNCKDEDDETAPELPSESTIVIDFSDFVSKSKIFSDKADANWEFASSNLEYWDSIISDRYSLPVQAYSEAQNIDKPEYITYKVWYWQNDFIISEDTIKGQIYESMIEDDSLYIEVFMSKTTDTIDFRWFSGGGDLGLTKGNWTFRDSVENKNDCLLVEWSNIADTLEVKYTNILTGDDKNGDNIYSKNVNGISGFDSYLQICYKTAADTIEIEWNTTSKEGRVKNLLQFGDELWHCWDGNLNDIVCPEK